MAALHAKVDPTLQGQRCEFVVSWLRSEVASDGAYTFMMGTVQGPAGRPLDWTKSSYAERHASGILDGGHIEALARKDARGNWTILEYAIGSTDVWWLGLPSDYPNAPRSLFPFVEP